MKNKRLLERATQSERYKRISVGAWNEEKISQITVRVSQSTRDGLEEIAKGIREDTGEECRLADIVRLALNEFIEREQ